MRYVLAAAAFCLLSQGAFAFEETTIGGGGDAAAKAPAAPALELPAVPGTGKGIDLTTPGAQNGLHLGQTPGTEVRIPGLGTVGVLPKLDFGLELLYGTNDQQKGLPEDKSESDGVQLRGTIKHRF